MDGLESFTGIRGFRSQGQLGAWMAGGGVSAVSPSFVAAMAAAMVVVLSELGSVCLSQRGRVEREGGNACYASSSAGEMEKWRTARLGASSPWRVERPSSTCVQGGGAAWRGREASGEPKDGEGWGRDEGAARGRRRDGDAVTVENRARR